MARAVKCANEELTNTLTSLFWRPSASRCAVVDDHRLRRVSIGRRGSCAERNIARQGVTTPAVRGNATRAAGARAAHPRRARVSHGGRLSQIAEWSEKNAGLSLPAICFASASLTSNPLASHFVEKGSTGPVGYCCVRSARVFHGVWRIPPRPVSHSAA